MGVVYGGGTDSNAQFHVYRNDGAGGPVDYSAPVATVAALSYAAAVPADGSDTTYAVRAFDPATGYEEDNTDATARLILDGSGNDVSGRPVPPDHVAARPAMGGLVVSWGYAPGTVNPPTGFKVWVATPGPVDYSGSPHATVGYVAGRTVYTLSVTGLTPGATYAVAVRATNAAGDDPGTASASAPAPGPGPSPVDSLSGSAVN